MTRQTRIPTPPEVVADAVLESTLAVVKQLIREGKPLEQSLLYLDRAQRHVEPMLTGGAQC